VTYFVTATSYLEETMLQLYYAKEFESVFVIFEVFNAATMKIILFLILMPCSW
jgi:hypothetical protein